MEIYVNWLMIWAIVIRFQCLGEMGRIEDVGDRNWVACAAAFIGHSATHHRLFRKAPGISLLTISSLKNQKSTFEAVVGFSGQSHLSEKSSLQTA